MSVIVLVAVDVLSFPCDGGLLESKKDGVDEVKGFLLRVREECSAENANGVNVVTSDGNSAGGDVVCFANVEDMEIGGVDSCEFTAVRVTVF